MHIHHISKSLACPHLAMNLCAVETKAVGPTDLDCPVCKRVHQSEHRDAKVRDVNFHITDRVLAGLKP